LQKHVKRFLFLPALASTLLFSEGSINFSIGCDLPSLPSISFGSILSSTLSASLGPCTLEFKTNEEAGCLPLMTGENEFEKLIPSYKYSLGCKSPSFVSDTPKMNLALLGKIPLTSRISNTINRNSGNLYFTGGESTLESMQVVLTESSLLGQVPSYSSEEKKSLALEAPSEQCQNLTDIQLQECEKKKKFALFDNSTKNEMKIEKKELSRMDATIEVATSPQEGMFYPSEEAREKYPIEKRLSYLQAGVAQNAVNAMKGAIMQEIGMHQDAMRKLQHVKNGVGGIGVSKKSYIKRIENVPRIKLP